MAFLYSGIEIEKIDPSIKETIDNLKLKISEAKN